MKDQFAAAGGRVNVLSQTLKPDSPLLKISNDFADQDDAIGKVLSSEVKGMRQHEIGNAQAWYYPTDKKIVLWECFLEASLRTHPFIEDPRMRKLWSSFEKRLVKQYPAATSIATPFNDPIARSIEEYQTFLRSLGYEPVAQAAYGKPL